MAPPPSRPLREHRLRDIKSSTGSPPPPSLRNESENQPLQLPFRLLAESLALAAASASALSDAAGDARARALAAAGDLAARSLVHPLRSTATQACVVAFGTAGAASAVIEASTRLAHSAAEAVGDMLLPLSFLCNQAAAAVRLAGALLTYLGWGGLWLLQAFRLVAYALLLLPGFARVGHFYFTSRRVARGVRYGSRPRNTADLYVPPGCGFSAAELAAAAAAAVAQSAAATHAASATSPKDARGKKSSIGSNPAYEIPPIFAASSSSSSPPPSSSSSPSPSPRPVVVYVTGGAWLIGHRAWGSLLAARLSAAAGAVVLCLDYRNFPQAGAGGAAEDVGAGIGWAVAAFDVLSGVKRESNGGGKRGKDKSSTSNNGGGVVVVGQSAGAHLSALAILSRCAAADGVALPCVSAESAARMMGAAAAAGANAPSPKASPSPGSSVSSSAAASVDVEVDATENVVVLSAPPTRSSSRPGSSSSLSSSSSSKEPKRSPSALYRHPSMTLPNPLLHPLTSLADAAATLGACDPRLSSSPLGGCFSPPLDPPEWCCPGFSKGDIAAFVGVSGVYDVASLAPHLAKRGLRPRLLERIMSLPTATATANGGERANGATPATSTTKSFWKPALAELSPTVLLLDCLRKQKEDADASAYLSASLPPLSYWPSRMPPTALLHGTADACAPASDAARFVEAARAAGAKEVSLRLYDGETHTSPLIENPMRGWGRDALGADLAALVVAAAVAAARSNGGGGRGGSEPGGRRRSSPAAAPAPAPATTSATLLRISSSSVVVPAPKASSKQRLGAVDGGGSLCPAPLISAAAVVCPF